MDDWYQVAPPFRRQTGLIRMAQERRNLHEKRNSWLHKLSTRVRRFSLVGGCPSRSSPSACLAGCACAALMNRATQLASIRVGAVRRSHLLTHRPDWQKSLAFCAERNVRSDSVEYLGRREVFRT